MPKQYAPLHGATVVELAIAPFLHGGVAGGLRGLVVVLSPDDRHFAELPISRGATCDSRVSTTIGGATRAASVLAGLRAAARLGAAPEDWVLVHDAARPCLCAAELAALFAALSSPAGAANGALLALPVADTVKRAMAAGSLPQVAMTVPREGLWRALTPQAFRHGTLLAALEGALAGGNGVAPPTDESAAVETLGLAPVLVAGSPYNVKVTLPADLAFAATVLQSRAEERSHGP